MLDPVVKARLYDASDEICRNFAKLVDKATDCLIERQVTPTELSGFALNELESSRMKYPADLSAKLESCKEVRGVLYQLLHRDCDIIVFYDFGILESIINKYCRGAEALTEELKQYNMKLDVYLSMRICEHQIFTQNLGTRVTSVSENAKLYLFMDSTWTKDVHLRKLFRLQKRVAAVLKCGNIQLKAIWVGSLCFCYNILKKDYAHSELQIQQILKLINFGIKEISGYEYSKCMEKACKFVCTSFVITLRAIYLPCAHYHKLSVLHSVDEEYSEDMMLPVSRLPVPAIDWRG